MMAGIGSNTRRAVGSPARASHFFLFALLLVFAAACIAAFAPGAQPAWAASYSSPQTTISAQVQTDGSLHATEVRMLEFPGASSGGVEVAADPVAWVFKDLTKDEALQVNSVRMAAVAEDGSVSGEWQALQGVSFSLEWREGDAPDGAAYSIDAPLNTVYVFPGKVAGHVVVELDYSISNMVTAWRDVAELNWTYVAEQWPVASKNVEATLSLPVPQGQEVAPGETVRAWGHGPASGTVEVGEAGVVVYRADEVLADQYASARVVFPPSWLTHLSGAAASTNRADLRLSAVESEESGWTDTWSWQQVGRYSAYVALAAVCALLLAAALVVYFRRGREYVPAFTGAYLREVPEAGLSPAVAGRLLRWGRADLRDLTATIMALAHKGVVRIEPRGSSWSVSLAAEGAGRADLDELEASALRLLFGPLPDGACATAAAADGAAHDDGALAAPASASDGAPAASASVAPNASIDLGRGSWVAAERAEAFVGAAQGWQELLEARLAPRGFFEAASTRWQKIALIAAGAAALAGVLGFLLFGDAVAAALLLPTAVAVAVIANYLPRRTACGNDLAARCKALRNWLRDLPVLGEVPAMSEQKWGELLPFGYVFGVASRAVRADGAPQPAQWLAWYDASATTSAPGHRCAADALNEALERTLREATAQASAARDAARTGGGFGRSSRHPL